MEGGTLQTQYSYQPFGVTSITGSSGNSFQFTGRENDGTGLIYFRARHYHPILQRFISEDPVTFAGGDVNFYQYVLANPVNFVDPNGLEVQVCRRNKRGSKSIEHPVVYLTNYHIGFGFGPASYWWAPVTPLNPVPGQIETEFPYGQDGKLLSGYSAVPITKSRCVEDCIYRESLKDQRNPPKYNLGKYQCNDWVDEVIRRCTEKCKGCK